MMNTDLYRADSIIPFYSSGYGYGVFVDSFFNRRAIFHSGSLTGFTSLLINYPVEGQFNYK